MIVKKIAEGNVVDFTVKDRSIVFSTEGESITVEIPTTNVGPEQVIDIYKTADGKLTRTPDTLHAVTLKIPPSRTSVVNNGNKDYEGNIILETVIAEVSMDQVIMNLWPFNK